MSANIQNLSLFLSEAHSCNYLDDMQASNLFIDPSVSPGKNTYSSLLEHGFRRSGHNVYRPHCGACQKCISTRVNSRHFQLKKTQKRCFQKNRDLQVFIKPASFQGEHFQLYDQYLNSKHSNSGMDGSSETDYKNFLISAWSETLFVEFRLNNKLLAVAVTDIINNGLSAVYTFYTTDQPFNKRSLGVYAILWQIDECKRRGLDWLYLGYWIAENRKMSYKNLYQPAEYFINGKWTGDPKII